MTRRVIISEERDPYYNVAAEYELLDRHADGYTLFIWHNQPSVFIGRNQNLYAECNLDYLEKKQILAVRRFTGGGAVFQDDGNLNFSLICNSGELSEESLRGFLIDAMARLGIACNYSGRNDVLLDDRKISGQAYLEQDGKILYHGTILYDVDLEQMSYALSPSSSKLSSKGIASVRSRVANIKDFFPNIKKEDIVDALVAAFRGDAPSVEVEHISDSNYLPNVSLYQKLTSKEWLYGESPDWDITLDKKYSYGNVSVHLKVSDGYIADAKIYTDSLQPVDFSECERMAKGQWFDEKNIFDVVKEYAVIE